MPAPSSPSRYSLRRASSLGADSKSSSLPCLPAEDAYFPAPNRKAAGFRSGAGDAGRGSCLQLWTQKDIKANIGTARYQRYMAGDWSQTSLVMPRRKPPSAPSIRPVTEGQLTESELEDLIERTNSKRVASLAGCNSSRQSSALELAWCDMVESRMSGSGDCFFTGSYSDSYGYAHGLMKSHNVIKDFIRFMTYQGLEDHNWVCAVELHKYRDILHLHALISGLGDFSDRVNLEHSWRASQRGFQVTAEPLLDRGIAYCTKYALKGQNAADFEWSWTA